MITPQLIEQFDECLKKYCPLVYAYYNDALTVSEIDSSMRELGLDTEDNIDFKTIYQWKNGIDLEVQDHGVDMSITSAGNFLSLKDMIALCHENSG